eukprot:EG_transcript_11905
MREMLWKEYVAQGLGAAGTFIAVVVLSNVGYKCWERWRSSVVAVQEPQSSPPTSGALLRDSLFRTVTHSNPRRCALAPLQMVRNVDAPEAIIFHGLNPLLSPDAVPRRGVARLIREAMATGAACILLIEGDATALQDATSRIERCGAHAIQRDVRVFHGATAPGPEPQALLQAMLSVSITPAGFGGSSGFGSSARETPRAPLPKHCVVLVRGRGRRAGGVAARKAGMRVVCVEEAEDAPLGPEDHVDDVADAVVSTLGEEGDWEVVTVDDISTPGSFWLNPPYPRDEFGNKVDWMQVMVSLTRSSEAVGGDASPEGDGLGPDGLTDAERAILADIAKPK